MRKKIAEYPHFDGETYITFNIVYVTEKEVQLAVTNRSRISVLTYDLYEDENVEYRRLCERLEQQ